jgi:hypothetical protein
MLTTDISVAMKARAVVITDTHFSIVTACSTSSATAISVSFVLIMNSIKARGLN